jgi:hypothetical protein
LIKQSLTVEIAYEGKMEPTTVGVPQGSPISPLYNNIYLNLLDQVWHRRGYPEKLGPLCIAMRMMVRHESAKEDSCKQENFFRLCCTRDERRPLELALQDGGSNHRKLLRHNGRGGERFGKGRT